MTTIVMVAAGTGGHIFPVLALALELRELGMRPILAGRTASLEQELAVKAGFQFWPVASSGFFGKRLAARLLFGVTFVFGLVQMLRLLLRTRPAAVVAGGGFGSVAPIVAARLCHLPYYLLEQNCIPGRVTRYLGRGAAQVFLTFPLREPLRARTVVTGTPLRRALLNQSGSSDGRTILVLGGSLGARALNRAAIELAQKLPDLHFIVLTGRRDYAEMKQQAAGLQNIELVEFTLAMAELYRRASLVISRAGGMVINEILAFGLPSILVPFPFATDNHQEANAQHIARLGGARQIDQSRLPEIASIVRELFDHPEQLAAMAARARASARPDAAQVIARSIRQQLEAGR